MSTESESGPREVYADRLELRQGEEDRWGRREIAVSNARLVVFVAGGIVAWLAVGAEVISGAFIAVPLAAFGTLMAVHERVIRSRRRAKCAAAFFEAGLARLEGRWAGKGVSGERFEDARHPYAADLDLFGTGGLFELLCSARTRMGENALAAWLRAPAPASRVLDRQAAVGELRPRIDLREDLWVLGEEVRAAVEPGALASWSTSPSTLPRIFVRQLAAVCSALTLGTLIAWAFLGTGPWPATAALAAQLTLAGVLRMRVRKVLDSIDRPGRDLAVLAGILGRFERERFESALLAELRSSLDTDGAPPSKRIAALARLVDLANSRRNQIFAPLAAFLMWGTQCAFAVESWRERFGKAVPGWLGAVGELEALGSLAGHAYEHPDDPFPEITDEGPLFDGRDLGHPLLDESECVRNDVRLDDRVRLFVVSGSNMSGKSTLLRTVGINAVLAQAGAPVRARSLRLSPLAVGATLRVQDSLQEGASRFYAEITRLHQLVQIADGPLPLMFLLDEILHGTNSHDRRIGAEAVVRALVERGGIGLVTTHDLALVRIADELAPQAANVHFEDHLEDDRVTFDFRLRSGVVRKSNALELMRSVGLEV